MSYANRNTYYNAINRLYGQRWEVGTKAEWKFDLRIFVK